MKELDYQYMMLLPFVIVYNLYFFRRTHQSGHHEVLGGAPGVADTLIVMYGSQKFASNLLPNCRFEIGGKHEPKGKKLKLDTDLPSCVLIVESSQPKLFSVQINSKHNSVCSTIRLSISRSDNKL